MITVRKLGVIGDGDLGADHRCVHQLVIATPNYDPRGRWKHDCRRSYNDNGGHGSGCAVGRRASVLVAALLAATQGSATDPATDRGATVHRHGAVGCRRRPNGSVRRRRSLHRAAQYRFGCLHADRYAESRGERPGACDRGGWPGADAAPTARPPIPHLAERW